MNIIFEGCDKFEESRRKEHETGARSDAITRKIASRGKDCYGSDNVFHRGECDNKEKYMGSMMRTWDGIFDISCSYIRFI